MKKNTMSSEEFVRLNGIDHYLYHSVRTPGKPVLLFLHGGPGSAESVMAHAFQQSWLELFTVVHWDQRGAGKTLLRNPREVHEFEAMVEDLRQVIGYLKTKYSQKKIALLGHSWGSVFGTSYLRKHPEDVSFYIGVGQVVSMMENERVGYEKVRELILEARDRKSLKELDAVGPYPPARYDDNFLKTCFRVRKLQARYGLALKWDLAMVKAIVLSPIFRWSDLLSLTRALKANARIMEFLVLFDLDKEPADYTVPMYCIMGGDDWQTPHTLAEAYFDRVQAPVKKFFRIPGAGHFTMMDRPEAFFEALKEIWTENSGGATIVP